MSPNFAVADLSGNKVVKSTKVLGTTSPEGRGTPVEVWLNALERVVDNQAGELKRFEP